MSNDSDKSLVKITDLFGVAKPLEQLVSAIERGVGNFMRPIQKRRDTKADISSFNNWNEAISRTGLSVNAAELTLSDRAIVRLTADNIRKQHNRELVAIEAVNEHLHTLGDSSNEPQNTSTIEAEWLDRFWRLAEDVTDKDMQTVWGRILARQAKGPARYSARCLEALSLLSRQEAKDLETLSKFVIEATAYGEPSHFFLLSPYLVSSDRPSQTLTDEIQKLIGNPFQAVFGPAGFYVDSGSGWAQDIKIDVEDGKAPVRIARKQFVIRYNASTTCLDKLGSGLGITPLGAEIFSLIESEPDSRFIELFSSALSHYGLRLEDNS